MTMSGQAFADAAPTATRHWDRRLAENKSGQITEIAGATGSTCQWDQ